MNLDRLLKSMVGSIKGFEHCVVPGYCFVYFHDRCDYLALLASSLLLIRITLILLEHVCTEYHLHVSKFSFTS